MSNCTISYHAPSATVQGRTRPPKAKRLPKARRQTERDLKRLDDQVEKIAIAIGGRFGDIDGFIVQMTGDLLDRTREWVAELREYMDEKEADGAKWEL